MEETAQKPLLRFFALLPAFRGFDYAGAEPAQKRLALGLRIRLSSHLLSYFRWPQNPHDVRKTGQHSRPKE